MRMMKLSALSIAAFSVSAAGHARGSCNESQEWRGVGSPLAFLTASNWSPAQVPGVDDSCEFNVSGSRTVTFSADVTTCQFLASSGSTTLDLNGHTYTVTTLSGSFWLATSSSHTANVTLVDGTVSCQDAVVGNVSPGTGTFVVGAGGVLDCERDLGVGGYVNSPGGTLVDAVMEIVSDGYAVAENVILGGGYGYFGRILVDGSDAALEARGDIHIGYLTAGEIEIRDGGSVTAGDVIVFGTLGQGGLLFGEGDVTATEVIAAQGAFVSPGSDTISGDTAILTIDGDYTQDSAFVGGGTLAIHLKGASAGAQHDRLDVSGDVTLDGELDVDLASGCSPCAGTTFTILTGATRAGTFATTSLPSFGDCRSVRVVYCSDRVMLVVDTISGDVDFDGDVDNDDAAVVTNNFNQSGCAPAGDANFDGVVNFTDLNIVASNNPSSCSLSSCP